MARCLLCEYMVPIILLGNSAHKDTLEGTPQSGAAEFWGCFNSGSCNVGWLLGCGLLMRGLVAEPWTRNPDESPHGASTV